MTALDAVPDTWAEAARSAETDALSAATEFGSALRASPEYRRLLSANEAMGADPDARAAIGAYNEKQDEFRAEAAMNLLSDEQAGELGRLLETMYAVPSVVAYVDATRAFEGVCRETAAVITSEIGVDFAANCRSGGCCGG